jgi:DNA polymerase-1
MRVAVVGAEGGGLLQAVAEDGTPQGPPEPVRDLPAAVAERERAGRPRWVWAATPELYSALLAAGVRVDRGHDLTLTEGILLAADGRWGEPRSLPAAWARLQGLSVPEDTTRAAGGVRGPGQPALFDHEQLGQPGPAELLEQVVAVHADQQRRLAGPGEGGAAGAAREGAAGGTGWPAGLGLLVAAESAGALAAVEMAAAGLPWRPEVHDAVLTELLGPRPRAGVAPRRLTDLATRVGEALGDRRLNPDSPVQVLRAFANAGTPLPSTRSHVLRGVDHPAVPMLLAYKELSRLHATYGWSWLDAWVAEGRFRPEYVPGGVVSGRWATRGGGALQIPHALRRAVVADPGWTFVVADASQLEPRVLAALSGDDGLARAAAGGDLYAALAADAFGGDRARAKTALLAAMYGGDVGQLMTVLRRRFPAAVGYVEAAARTGEEGGLVRSQLGRTCPSPSRGWLEVTGRAAMTRPAGAGWLEPTGPAGGAGPQGASRLEPTGPGAGPPATGAGAAPPGRRAARDRGRFTRNFVVQASAADWALVLLAAVRRRLAGQAAHLVFFQHDEVVVHCPRDDAPSVADEVREAAAESGRLVFGDTPVRFPLSVAVVDCYADAK